MKPKALIATAVLSAGMILQVNGQEVVTDSLGFDKVMASSPAALLQGQVSGVRVSGLDGNANGALSTLIRGVNSLRGDSQPLWIVDGVIVNTDLNRNLDAFFQYGESSFTSSLNLFGWLNPYDIESVEVLKDLSAAAVYGAKAANGVIIVTTKHAKSEGYRVEWDSNLGISAPSGDIDGTRTGISHNHSVSLSGATGATNFGVSAFLRSVEGVASGNESLQGGFRAGFDTKANSAVWFGMNSFVSIGEAANIAGASYFGTPSMTLDMRKDGLFSGSSLDGWKADYDDFANEKRLVNSMYLTLNFTPALSLKTTVGIDYGNNERHIWYGDGTVFGASKNGAASLLASSVFKYNASSVLTYNRIFSDIHSVKASAGIDASGENTAFNTENGTDFFNHLLRSKGLNLAASKAALHKYIHNYSTAGGFLNGTYNYGKLIGADFTLRLDKTGRYDDKANLYKSAGIWADLSETTGLPTLKLTAGYGEGGKEQYIPYGLYGNYLSGAITPVADGLSMFYEALGRLTSREFNVGVDLGIMDNALKAHLGYYSKKTDDAFNSYCFGKQYKETTYWETAPRQDDFSRTTTIANSGFEFDLSWNVIDNADQKWNVYANAAYNVNSLVSVDADDATGLTVGGGLIPNANIEGNPVGAICDGAGNVIGNPLPKLTYAVGTDFTCGPVKVDLLLNGASGFDILNLNEMAINGATAVSSEYVENGNYLKLSRLAASYKLPLDSVKWIRGAEVVLSGLNLLTLTDYSGWNPEVNCFGKSGYTNGLDYGSYPAFRSFVLGIRLNF